MSHKYVFDGVYSDLKSRRFKYSEDGLLTHDGSDWVSADDMSPEDFASLGILSGSQVSTVDAGGALDYAETEEFDDKSSGEFAFAYEGDPVKGGHLGYSSSPITSDGSGGSGGEDCDAYCDRDDVEQVFGVSNVEKWADLDNDDDDDKIEERVQWACCEATAEINSRLLGGPYTTPFDEPYPRELVRRTAQLAGVILYDARGSVDMDVEDEPVHRLSSTRKMVEKWLRMILAGKIKFSGVSRATEVPTVVVDED